MVRSSVSEVYLRDPWDTRHPQRESCDEFLTIFSDLYVETLAEMGLFADEQYDPAFLSDDEFENVFQALADKLAANSEAVRLMDELNINFNLEALEMDEFSHLAGLSRGTESYYASMA